MRVRAAGAAFAAAIVLIGIIGAHLEARAGGPIVFRDHLDDTFIAGFCGFPMEIRTTGTGVFHVFLDEAGNFHRVIITSAAIRITFTNLATGESVWTPSVNMTQFVAEDGTETQTLRGLLWRLVLPKEGLVTADVGRIDFRVTFDEQGEVVSEEVVFAAGQQENQFLPAVCSALAP